MVGHIVSLLDNGIFSELRLRLEELIDRRRVEQPVTHLRGAALTTRLQADSEQALTDAIQRA